MPPNSEDQDRQDRVEKRSVRIANHRTSISLEAAFWEELKRLAREQGLSVNQVIKNIDMRRQGNLSSALRLYVLEELKRAAGDRR